MARIVTRDGRKAIRLLRAGTDWVLARHERSGETAWKPVVAHYSNRYQETVRLRVCDIDAGAQHTLVSNRVHPFWVADAATEVRLVANGHAVRVPGSNTLGRWVEAQELELGDRLLDDDGSYSVVADLEIAPEPLEAYNITVGEFHTFFVAGADNDNVPAVWVHNSCDWVIFRGLVQNRPLGELTHADLVKAFQGAGYELTSHAVMCLGDSGISHFGINTLSDVASILSNSTLVNADHGAMARFLNGAGVVFDPQTKHIITIRPW